MKKTLTSLSILIALSLVAWMPGSGTNALASSNGALYLAQAGQTAQPGSAPPEKNDYINQARKEFAQLDLRIEQLRIKLGQAAKEKQDELYQLSYSLESLKAEAMQQMKALEEQSGEKWKEMKSGLSNAMDDLKKHVDELDSRLK